jgi:hypothetical protein
MPTTRCAMRLLATIWLCGVAPSACATVPGHDTGQLVERLTAGPDPHSTSRRADVVTASELESFPAASTIESLRRLRPEFFRPVRSALDQHNTAGANPVVYVDDAYNGGLESLETVPKAAVREVRFLRPMQAVERWGPSCPCGAGVVLVVTKRER